MTGGNTGPWESREEVARPGRSRSQKASWFVADEQKSAHWLKTGGLYCLVSTIFRSFVVVVDSI